MQLRSKQIVQFQNVSFKFKYRFPKKTYGGTYEPKNYPAEDKINKELHEPKEHTEEKLYIYDVIHVILMLDHTQSVYGRAERKSLDL